MPSTARKIHRPGYFVPLILVIVFNARCTHYYYMPGLHNVPLMKEANEAHFTAGVAAGDETTTTELQGSYAVTDHLALMGSFMSAEGSEGSNAGYGRYGDAAIGYFAMLGEDASFEMFAGAGHSSQHHDYSTSVFNPATGMTELRKTYADLKFYRTFVQANIGASYNSFDFALSGRVAQLNFYDIQYTLLPTGGDLALDRLAMSPQVILFEPAVTLRTGWKYVKVQGQLGLSFQLGKVKHPFESLNAGIGMYFTIAKRFWKK